MTSSPEGFPPQDLRSFLELCAGEWLALRSHFDLALVEAAEPSPGAAGERAASVAGSAVGSDMAAPGAQPASTSPAAVRPASSSSALTGAATPAEGADPSSDDALPDFTALLQQARSELEEAPLEDVWHRSERAELLVSFLAPASGDQPGGLRVSPPGGSSLELHFRLDGSFGSTPDSAAEGRWQLWPDGSVELTTEAPGRLLRERIWFTQPNLRLRSSIEHGEGGVPGRARFSSEIRRVRKPAP